LFDAQWPADHDQGDGPFHAGNSGSNRLMIDFGTGQEVPITLTGPTRTAAARRALGIWDWDMTSWEHAVCRVKYAPSPVGRTITTARLTAQTITLLSSGSGPRRQRARCPNNTVVLARTTACGKRQ